MTVHDPISTLVSEHKRAIAKVNRWRGHCIDCFARIELSAVEALDHLIKDGRMQSLERKSLFGPRLKMLKTALRDETFGEGAVPPRKALAALEPILDRRNALVHGVGRVWIVPGGDWLWRYRFEPNGAGEVTDGITSTEAEQIERDLASNAQRLRDTLKNLVENL